MNLHKSSAMSSSIPPYLGQKNTRARNAVIENPFSSKLRVEEPKTRWGFITFAAIKDALTAGPNESRYLYWYYCVICIFLYMKRKVTRSQEMLCSSLFQAILCWCSIADTEI